MFNKIYIIASMLICVAVVVVFDTFPRSTKSLLEKRKLATFPEFTTERLLSGDFTRDVSFWFSDSEPFRDEIMSFSMKVKELESIKMSDDNITFIASDEQEEEEVPKETEEGNRNIQEYKNNVTADLDAKMANSGMMIVGKGKNVRALMGFRGTARYAKVYSDMVNKYQTTFGKGVQVYSLIIPTAIEFYCPDKAKDACKPQYPVIKASYELLDSTVKAVDAYSVLGQHANENIYLRTDHHWSPLGGFYAAQKFASVAGVPFKPLSSYTKHVIHGYVGSMYGYTGDASIKEAPEDFVYWTPNGVQYNTTYVNYKTANHFVIGENPPTKGEYFHTYPDGSGNAYCTFMGGDSKITKVETSTKNGRRLAILKDSFGNTLPGYLFYSFEEIHVIDYRYFLPNLTKYVKDNKITDFLVTLNIFRACSPGLIADAEKFLTQDPVKKLKEGIEAANNLESQKKQK